ncbi:MAG: phenylacetate--CoA ligase family protein [Bdellovibrionota bacterium]|jgi:phenylacetate-CoA ligase
MTETISQDYLSQDYLRRLQLQRLQAIVSRAYDNVSLFRNRLDERGIKPTDIKSLEDIQKLPFSYKQDLRDSYPFGLFASPMKDIIRLHASSGTTGKPIVVAYTKEDLKVWSDSVRRSLSAAGLTSSDIIQNSYGYGLFTGGLGAHYGVEALGATVIPTSGGNTDRQLMVMQDFGVTAISCTPSYLTHIVNRAAEIGIDLKKLPIRTAILGAEPWSEEMGSWFEEQAGIKAYDIYGLSEITGPGAAAQCAVREGLHVFEDYFYPEIIDSETGEVLPDGEEGELVLTTLCKMAIPMIRYCTRDITSIITEPCPCGRTLRRIRRISRRADDMIILRGVNIYPSQIEAALLSVDGTLPVYQIVLTKERGLDQATIEVEVTPEIFSDKIGALQQLRRKLEYTLETTTSIRIAVSLVKMNTVQKSEGKAVRVIDNRNK